MLSKGGAMRHFVVAATARSGTTFTAQALSRMGYRCGHEQVFSPWQPWGFHGWRGFDGDVSCYSVPFIEDLPENTLLVHQVRDPMATIRSLANWGIFMPFSPGRHVVMPLIRWLRGKPPRELAFRFLRANNPAVWNRRDGELARATQHWIEWNSSIEIGAREAGVDYWRIRVEDLRGEKLGELTGLIGGNGVAVCDDLGTSVNAGSGSRYGRVTLADLPDDLRVDVKRLATLYGYDIG
jgi:hypothetical protein